MHILFPQYTTTPKNRFVASFYVALRTFSKLGNLTFAFALSNLNNAGWKTSGAELVYNLRRN